MEKISKQKRQAAILYVASLSGIVLGVLSSIVNTRYVDPEVYGDVRYVQNILNFISSILLLGFFQSGSRLLALSDSIKYSRQIKGCMVVILSVTVAIQMLFCYIGGLVHLEKTNLSQLFWISIPVCGYPLLLNYMNTTAQGDNQIIRLSMSRLLPALLYVPIAYVVYKYFGATAQKMILMQWGIASIVLLSIIISTRPSFDNVKSVWSKLKKENRSYGSQLYIGSLVMVTTNYIAGITLGMFNQNNTEVGFYTLALTVTSPLATLPAIIGTTYFKEFSRQAQIPKKVMRATLLLTLVSCVLFIILIKPVVGFLYPKQYSSVGLYAIILSVGYSMHGFGDMINRYLGSHGEGRSIRNASIANGIFKVFGFTVLVYFFNVYGALITIVACDAIYMCTLIYYYRGIVKDKIL